MGKTCPLGAINLLKEFSHIDAYELADRLKKEGVETRPFFLGMHDQPVFNDIIFLNEKYPVSDYIAKNGLYLPSGLALTIEQLNSHQMFGRGL